MNDKTTSADQPLSGVRVVEIGASVAAPYAAWILAALGADVIKVEREGAGDDARYWGRIPDNGISSTFQSLNRDKRAITVDLKREDDRAWLRRLCLEDADVVLQNMRPGTIARYGLGSAELIAEAPSLIYCNLWAYGANGPLKSEPGYDPLMQAQGGLMSVTGEEGQAPIRVGTSIVDMGTGMWCAIGILAALGRRNQTGSGCVIDASLYETAIAWMANHVAGVQVDGLNPVKAGSGIKGMAPYQAYLCSDGYLIIAAPNDSLFERLSLVLEHPEWVADQRFDSNQKRSGNLEQLNALMEPVIVQHSRAHWRALLDEVGVPSAPVQSTLEMMAAPQSEALGIFQSLPGNDMKLVGLPLSFDGKRPDIRRMGPKLGEHNEEIRGKK